MRMVRPIIQSTKHYVQHTISTLATLTAITLVDVNARQLLSVNTPDDVIEGSSVKAVFVEMWIRGEVANSAIVMTFEKAAGGQPNATFTQLASGLGTYPNKKNVLYTTQGLVGEVGTNPIPFYRAWVKIPKGKQRFGLNDQFRINIANIGSGSVDFCGLTVYKSYE